MELYSPISSTHKLANDQCKLAGINIHIYTEEFINLWETGVMAAQGRAKQANKSTKENTVIK